MTTNQETNTLVQAATAMQEVCNTFVANMLAAITPMWQNIHGTMYDAYMQAGYPYGESEEGLQHWMQDLATSKDHQIAIDCILQSHQNKIDARKLGERIRAKRLERGE